MLSSTLGHSIKPFLLAMVFTACALRVGAESRSEPLASEAATDPRSVSSTERDDGADPEKIVATGSRVEPGLVVPYQGDHDDDDVEEVVVTARPPERGKAPTLEFLTELYGSRRSGARLYRRGKHAESFPYLLAAARRGFKMAQARVSFLYRQGLGTPPDPTAAVAFLGIAAKPPTHPEIRRRFHEIWGRVPPDLKPGFEELIEQYDPGPPFPSPQ